MVTSLLYMLEGLLTDKNTAGATPQDVIANLEPTFVFASVWAFGMTYQEKDGKDYREMFSKWWRSEWKDVKFPARETVFDYYLTPATNKFDPWKNSPFFYPIEYESTTPMSTVTVPTPETASITHWMQLLIDRGRPVMLVGNAGCGKTQLVNGMLSTFDPVDKLSQTINFNFYTNAQLLQQTLTGPLEKKTGTNYGPPGNASMVYFLDDLNLPEVDEYNTQSAISLVRQHMDYGHVWDLTKLQLQNMMKCYYVACMNHTAGCFTINPRLQRWF